ncbi:NUDIX domain-containing protein [Nocardiopsis composta]
MGTGHGTVRIRVAALLFRGERLCLLRRDTPAGPLYALPGGKVEPGEPLDAALRRELREELGLPEEAAAGAEPLWIQDQMVSRPGARPAPRKLHLVYRGCTWRTARTAAPRRAARTPGRRSGSATARPPPCRCSPRSAPCSEPCRRRTPAPRR